MKERDEQRVDAFSPEAVQRILDLNKSFLERLGELGMNVSDYQELLILLDEDHNEIFSYDAEDFADGTKDNLNGKVRYIETPDWMYEDGEGFECDSSSDLPIIKRDFESWIDRMKSKIETVNRLNGEIEGEVIIFSGIRDGVLVYPCVETYPEGVMLNNKSFSWTEDFEFGIRNEIAIIRKDSEELKKNIREQIRAGIHIEEQSSRGSESAGVGYSRSMYARVVVSKRFFLGDKELEGRSLAFARALQKESQLQQRDSVFENRILTVELHGAVSGTKTEMILTETGQPKEIISKLGYGFSRPSKRRGYTEFKGYFIIVKDPSNGRQLRRIPNSKCGSSSELIKAFERSYVPSEEK